MSITVNTGVANTLHDTHGSTTAAPKSDASPFRAYIAAAAQANEKSSKAGASVPDKPAEFDPFSVVRSAAVPESNGFVLALEHMYGIKDGSITGVQIPSATTVKPHWPRRCEPAAQP